jgi:hypothetical protein
MTKTSLPRIPSLFPLPVPSYSFPSTSSPPPGPTVVAFRDTRDREQASLRALEESLEPEGLLVGAQPLPPPPNTRDSRYARVDILEAELVSRRAYMGRNEQLEGVLRKVEACMSLEKFQCVREEVRALLAGEQRVTAACAGQESRCYDPGYAGILEAPTEKTSRVDADLLIPGRGEPVRDACLVFKGGKILYAGARAEMPVKWRGLSAERVPVLMPGMWDW